VGLPPHRDDRPIRLTASKRIFHPNVDPNQGRFQPLSPSLAEPPKQPPTYTFRNSTKPSTTSASFNWGSSGSNGYGHLPAAGVARLPSQLPNDDNSDEATTVTTVAPSTTTATARKYTYRAWSRLLPTPGSVGVTGATPVSSTRDTSGHRVRGSLLARRRQSPSVLTLSYRSRNRGRCRR
jgi:hypothetical protein